MKKVVSKILFDNVTLVTTADYKVVYPIMRVHLHYVPKDWSPTHFDHWLGLEVSFFGDAGAETTGQNDCFQLLEPNDFLYREFRFSLLMYQKICVAH